MPAPSDPRTPQEAKEPPGTFWGRLRYLGPGLIITGSIVGSGELILTTKLGAEAGYVILWLIVIGCVLKVFVQVELGRYAISSGHATLRALDRLPGPRACVSWAVWLWAVMFVLVLFQTSGIAGAVAEVFAVPFPEFTERRRTLLVWAIAASIAFMLFWGRYRLVERVSIAMVFVFTCATVVAVGLVEWTDYAFGPGDILEGFVAPLRDTATWISGLFTTSDEAARPFLDRLLGFRLTLRDGSPLDFTTAFAAFGVTGVGASELVYYPYWCIEKGYARMVGPRDESPEWAERARGWIEVLRLDALVSLVVYTTATAAFYILGASILHGAGLEVEDKDLMPTLSRMYRETIGPAGVEVFLIGAFFVLYSTFFVATASNSRLFADALGLFKVLRYEKPASFRAVVRAAGVGLPLFAALLFVTLGKPVTLVMVGAIAQACMLPVLAFAAVYLRYRGSDPRLAPGRLWTFCLWLALASMLLVGAYTIADKLGLIFQPSGG